MADSSNVVINLSTGHEDAERVTIAFLVAAASLAKGKAVVMFLTKEAVRLALPGYADAIAVAGSPPVSELFDEFERAAGEFYVCPISFKGRKLDSDGLVANARLAGATPLWDFMGEGATVFSY